MIGLEEGFGFVLAASWRASCALILFSGFRRFALGRIPASFFYAGRIIIALGMVLPFSVASRWSPFQWLRSFESFSTQPEKPRVAGEVASGVTDNSVLVAARSVPVRQAPQGPTSYPGVKRALKERFFVEVWLAGICVMLAIRLRGIWVFRQRLRRTSGVPGPRLIQSVREYAAELGFASPPKLMVTSLVHSPAIYGLLRPRLLFPEKFADTMTEPELRLVVLHELGHAFRRDLLSLRLVWIARLVHWFNPLAWLAERSARFECELACDEFVLKKISSREREEYGGTLLKVLTLVAGKSTLVEALAISGNTHQLKERIVRIATYQATSQARALFGAVLLGCLVVIGATRASDANPPQVGSSTPPAADRPEKGSERQGVSINERPAQLREKALPFLQSQLDAKRTEAASAKSAIIDYAEKYPAASSSVEKDLLLKKIAGFGGEIVASMLEQMHLKPTVETVEEYVKNNRDLFEISAIANYRDLSSIKSQLDNLKMQRTTLSDRYTDSHPVMRENKLRISALEKLQDDYVNLAIADLRGQLERASSLQQKLRSELAAAENSARNFDQIVARRAFLEQEASNKEAAVKMLEEKILQLQLAPP